MGYEGNLLYLAARYSYIYLACMPFLSLTNFLTAILQAKGDTKTPFYVLTATGALNILLNIFFVLALGMSVEGVAIATAISNVVSAYILWYHLVKHGDECKIHFSHMRIHRFEFIDIFRVGFPSGIQSALFSFSNVIIQSSIVQVNNALTPSGSSYAPVIKGNAAAGDIETFIFSALAAISAASSAFTAQNVGAKNWNRIRMVFVRLSLIGTGIVLLMSALTVLFMDPLLSLYGVNNASDTLSALTYQTAELRIWWKCPALFIYAIMDACAGSIRGLGKSILSAIISIFTTCIFRVVWIYTVFAHFGTLEAIYISYPISWLLSLVIFLPLLFALIKRKERAEIKI
jgi:Na+-driven multidrug efflux pump